MPKYKVEVSWSGYSRGDAIYEVEAESEEEAMEDYWSGVEIDRFTVRDDTEGEAYKATLIEVKES